MNFKFIILFLIIFLNVKLGLADSKKIKSITLGHILTPTTETLSSGTCTVGFFMLGCGVNNQITLGTSPFLLNRYNMISLMLRYKFFQKDSESWSTDVRYYNTTKIGDNIYDMEALSTKITRATQININYTINLTLTYIYYFKENYPFSLRMFPFNGNSDEVAASSLHELKVTKNNGFLVEMGILGINYHIPYLHYGVSFYYKNINWFLQIGLSNTLFANVFERFLTNKNSHLFQVAHPEVQLQYSF